MDFIEKLDSILLLKNTLVKPESFNSIIEYINGLLRDYCVLHSKRYSFIYNEYILLYSCNDNKTCVYVEIKPIPINPNLDRLELSYFIKGSKCE